MPDTNIDRILVANASLPLFIAEVQKNVLDGYEVEFEGLNYPCNNGFLFECSMVKTEESRNQADRAKIARAKRADLEAAERAYMETLGKIGKGKSGE